MQTYELIEKQHQLLMQSAVLRLQFQEQVQHVIRPLSWVNKVHKGLSWLKNHPEWPIATLTLFVVVRPRRAVTWGGRLWWFWRLYQQLYRPL
jgi:hypothetical protein